jgi:hypothetical protein
MFFFGKVFFAVFDLIFCGVFFAMGWGGGGGADDSYRKFLGV